MELAPQFESQSRHYGTQAWRTIRPELAGKLSDARVQLHYAAQFATAAGISYLPALPDDSHTNLEWVPELNGLFSRVIPAKTPFRIGVKPTDLTMVVAPEPRTTIAEARMDRCTISDVADWVRTQITAQGADAERYALRRHYEIPPHSVAAGAPFDVSDRVSFDELSKWFASGALVMTDIARSLPDASEVRCWPHHFDIGILIRLGANQSVGVGLEPGDEYYNEPYFYVNMSPQSAQSELRSFRLGGAGTWHTSGWIGAVLPGSRLAPGPSQESQAREFLNSAIAAAKTLVARI